MEKHISVKKLMNSAIVVSALVLLTAVVSSPAHAYYVHHSSTVHYNGYGARGATVHRSTTAVVHPNYHYYYR